MPSKTLRSIIAAMGAALLLASCAGPTKLGGDPQLRVIPASNLPTPDLADLTTTGKPYLIGPFDKLTIDVFGIDELSQREVQVDASGRISFPLAGVIQVGGKTPGEVETLLEAGLARAHVRNPQVTVNLKETVSQVVTIDGQVKMPGQYPVLGKMTLLRSIAKAQGTTEYSRLDDVVIFRTAQGQRYAALYNLDAIRHGAYPDPEIYANDLIMVGDDNSRRLFKDLLQGAAAVAMPLVIGLNHAIN